MRINLTSKYISHLIDTHLYSLISKNNIEGFYYKFTQYPDSKDIVFCNVEHLAQKSLDKLQEHPDVVGIDEYGSNFIVMISMPEGFTDAIESLEYPALFSTNEEGHILTQLIKREDIAKKWYKNLMDVIYGVDLSELPDNLFIPVSVSPYVEVLDFEELQS